MAQALGVLPSAAGGGAGAGAGAVVVRERWSGGPGEKNLGWQNRLAKEGLQVSEISVGVAAEAALADAGLAETVEVGTLLLPVLQVLGGELLASDYAEAGGHPRDQAD